MSIKAEKYHFTLIQLSKIKQFNSAKFSQEMSTVILEGVQIV